jgi:ribonuclease HII
METIANIKKILEKAPMKEILQKLEIYKEDERTGVKNLITTYNSRYNKYIKELERLQSMNFYENLYYEKNFKYIAGVDEVGRGPLAGPILACSVILPKNTIILGVNDSKKLTKDKREELYKEITSKALSIEIGEVTQKFIDEFDVSIANFTAMEICIKNLKITPSIILVDGFKIPDRFVNLPQQAIIKGDSKSISIACASIIAKVTRDNIMQKYHEVYPVYGFDTNKGYGTQKHIEALKEYGPCPIHRLSFIKKLI